MSTSAPMSRNEELIAAIRNEIHKTPAADLEDVHKPSEEVVPEDDTVFGVKLDPRVKMDPFKHEDWDAHIQARIPTVAPYAFNAKNLERLLFAMKMGGPILLHGPTGTGKTSIAQQVAARLNIPFFRQSCHRDMESAEFLGQTGVKNEGGVPITYHSDTDTTLAMRYGGMLVIDEAFRTSALMSIQSVFEQPPSLVLQDADGVQRALTPTQPLFIVLTDNTNGTGDSSGKYIAQVQDLSTLDRVSHAIFVDYMTPDEEMEILSNVYGKPSKKDEKVQKMMVKTANLVRAAFKEGKIMQTMSIRGLMNWFRYYQVLETPGDAYVRAYWDKLGPDCKAVANQCYRQVFGKDVA